MFEQMESLEPRQLLAGNMLDIPDAPIRFASATITLLPEDAPRAVRSFMELRDQGKLVDVIFHRSDPDANASRAGLFRQTLNGLRYVPRTKRIDARESLPTLRGTVGFMRDPDNPGRTTGEIIFNRVNRPARRSDMVVFGTFTSLSRGNLVFDLRNVVDIEQAHKLGSVPARSGSTFENIDHLELGLGRLDVPQETTRLGGFATSDSAEWLSITNTTTRVRKYEVQALTGRERLNRIVARGDLAPGEHVVVKLHVGENLEGEQRDEHFPGTTDREVNGRSIRQNRPYTLVVDWNGTLRDRLDIHLERLERDPEFGVVRSMRLSNFQRLGGRRFSGWRAFGGALDFANDGAPSRLMLFSMGRTPSVVRIKGINDQGESFSFRRSFGVRSTLMIDLDAMPEVNGHVALIKVRWIAGKSYALLIDGQADFNANAEAATSSVGGTSTTAVSGRTTYLQRRLREGTPLELLIFNLTSSTVTITVEVSLVVCNGPDDCPDDPPGVPSFEPFELQAGQVMRFPFEDEALLFDQDFVFRLISRRDPRGDDTPFVRLYFDPAMLEEL